MSEVGTAWDSAAVANAPLEDYRVHNHENDMSRRNEWFLQHTFESPGSGPRIKQIVGRLGCVYARRAPNGTTDSHAASDLADLRSITSPELGDRESWLLNTYTKDERKVYVPSPRGPLYSQDLESVHKTSLRYVGVGHNPTFVGGPFNVSTRNEYHNTNDPYRTARV